MVQNTDMWSNLESTMIGTDAFNAACTSADTTAAIYEPVSKKPGKGHLFRRWSLRELRAQGITPME